MGLTVMLTLVVRKCLFLSEKMEEINLCVEQCLDKVNDLFQNAQKKAQLDIFLDEPVVRDLVNDLKVFRDTLLVVANKLVEPFEQENEEQQ